jgi:S-adenosylmethionine hydrolase
MEAVQEAARRPGEFDLISFVTDYGLSGGFVGALHAVVDSIAASATPPRLLRTIDLDHFIPPQDVLLGALRMERMTRYLRGGVHVGVVDPGVGTSRRPVAVEAGDRIFIGPDNGLLTFAADALGGPRRCAILDNEEYLLSPRSSTFDGRDIFAPAAAHAALGVELSELGSALEPSELLRLERPLCRDLGDGGIECQIVQTDGFGNVQLSAGSELLAPLGREVSLEGTGLKGVVAVPVGVAFGDVAAGQPLLLVDSDGCLAISVNRGRADELLQARRGDRVVLRRIS